MKVKVYKEWVPSLNEDMRKDGYWGLTLDRTKHYVDTIEVDSTKYDRRQNVYTVVIDGTEWHLLGALDKQRKRTGNTRVASELVRLAKELGAKEWHEDDDSDSLRDKAIREFSKHVGGEKIFTAEKVKGHWYVYTTELGAFRIARKYRLDWRDIGQSKNHHRDFWYAFI